MKNETRGGRRRQLIVILSVSLAFAVGGVVLDSTYGKISNIVFMGIYSVVIVLTMLWSERRAARDNRKQ